MLPIHEQLSKSDLNNTQMDFAATSLVPSAIWDKDSVYPKIQSGNKFELHMNDVFVNDFIDQTFNRDGIISAVSKIKFYSPPHPIFQHLPLKEKVKNIAFDRMRIGFINDTLTLVDICEFV